MEVLTIAVMAGDGIGPEIMRQGVRVLDRVAELSGFKVKKNDLLVGGAAIDATGQALPEKTLNTASECQAILFGSIGGPKWENLPAEKQPERASLLPLRKHFKLYANLRPVIVYNQLKNLSPLKDNYLGEGVDMLVVRELTGGIYFGQPKERHTGHALDTLVYKKEEIARIAKVAFDLALLRKKRVISVDKANVLTSMVFWREVVSEVAKSYPEVELKHMYVDNAAMQLIRNPSQFDVILTTNMFGDILSDEASVLTGSLGMLPSASINEDRFGLYEPAGGSAPDIANQNIANPIAQILCVAMMLRSSFGREMEAVAIENAVQSVLAKGIATADIASGGRSVSTSDMGEAIVNELQVSPP